MSPNNELEAVGKLVTEYKDVKRRLDSLQHEAVRVGQILEGLGKALLAHPQNVSLDGQSMPMDYHGSREDFPATSLNPDHIKKLTDDLRSAYVEINRLTPKIKELELQP